MDWDWSLREILWAVGLFVVSLVASTAIVCAMLVLIPPDYFVRRAPGRGLRSLTFGRLALVLGKNLLGGLLVVLGLLLSVPGVPGQGLLTILVGVMLLDVPRKRALERRLVERPAVRRGIDRLRARFGRAPLVLEPEGVEHERA